MKIETKFNVGDYCYYMENNNVQRGIIKKIELSIEYNQYLIPIIYTNYIVEKYHSSRCMEESIIHKTLEDLFEYLKENKND